MLKLLHRHSPRFFLTREESQVLADRVAMFEEKTACELVFHFRRKLGPDPLKKNEELFHNFGLHKTTHRNAILVTIAVTDRKFAIWADEGVIRHTSDKLWVRVTDLMSHLLKNGKRLAGLIAAMEEAEPILAKEQPHFKSGSQKNEIPNTPIIEDRE